MSWTLPRYSSHFLAVRQRFPTSIKPKKDPPSVACMWSDRTCILSERDTSSSCLMWSFSRNLLKYDLCCQSYKNRYFSFKKVFWICTHTYSKDLCAYRTKYIISFIYIYIALYITCLLAGARDNLK